MSDITTVTRCVEQALNTARDTPIEAATTQRLHAARSRSFVTALGDQLGALYTGQPDVRVFTKHDDRNRADFGMNELLYDVTVCGHQQGTPVRHRPHLARRVRASQEQ